MKGVKKCLLLGLSVATSATLFAACGGKGGENNGSSSDSSSSGVEVQGEILADEAAWEQAIQSSSVKTNAVISMDAIMESREGEYFMRETATGTMQLADGKMYQRGAGTYSYHYPDEESGQEMTGEMPFDAETYVGVVEGVTVEWTREVGQTEWDCYPCGIDFDGTVGSVISYMDIPFEAFARMYLSFQIVDDAYVVEISEEDTDGEASGKVEVKFVNGLLYSLVWDMQNAIDHDVPGGGTVVVGTTRTYISMVFAYGGASVGELPPLTDGGNGGNGGGGGGGRPVKPPAPEDCDHSFSEYYYNGDATCEKDGTKTAWCDYGCGETDTIVDEENKAWGHSFTYYEPNYDATCTEDGTKTAWCDYGCDETETIVDEGTKLEHEFLNYISNNDATCEKDGTKTAWCDYDCGKTDTIVDEGSKLEHKFLNYISNNDATCEKDGTKTATCDNGCGKTDTIVDEGTGGHLFIDYVSNEDATCEKDGTKTAKCENGCDETDTIVDEGSAMGHSFTDYKTDATGKQTATCDNGCGETDVKGEAVQDEAAWRKALTNSIDKTNATVGYVSKLSAEDEYGSYLEQIGTATAKLANKTLYELVTGTTVTNITDSYTGSFMTEMYVGYVDDLAMQWYRESTESAWECYPFNVDGAEFTGTLGEFMTMRSIPIAYFVDMFAAFTYDDGTYVYEVDITDNGEVGRIEIKFLNGLLYSYEQTVTVHETVEGIDGDGVAYMRFIISYADVDSIELPPMTWERPASEGLQFTLNTDQKSYTVTGMGSCQDTYIVIPETYENYPVTGIGTKAFNNRNITAVGIPASIVSIGSNAFSGCTSLKKVNIKDLAAWCNISFGNAMANPLYYTKNLHINNELVTKLDIPEGITEISSYAFYNYTGLTEVVISDSVTSIASYAFYNCTGLTEIVISDGVTNIDSSAFYNCTGLTEIVISDSVTNIASSAFYGCRYLTKVTMGSGVTDISSSAFENCSRLTEIIVADGNTTFQSIEGNLYSKDGTTLIKYAPGKAETSFRIPDGVTRIGDYAFKNSKNLAEIIISDSVTDIADNAFYGCSNLGTEKGGLKYLGNENNPYLYLWTNTRGITSAIIESGCKFIGASALSNCSGLTEIIIPESVTNVGSDAFEGCTALIIYCEIANQPSGWSNTWNPSKCPVVWDCNNNDVANDGYIYTTVEGLRYGIKEGEATVAKQTNKVAEATIPSEIVYLGQTYPVTRIAESAFDGNYTLKTLTFSEDSQLKTIGVYAFRGCQFLREIVLPDGIVSIESGAFQSCGLVTIEIPDSLTSIGISVFEQCTGLQYTIKDELKYLGNKDNPYVCLITSTNKQIQTANIVDECKIIAPQALSSCTNLTSLTIVDGVKYIGERAFDWCYRLTGITFGQNGQLKSIADSAFWSCSGLVEVVIPDGVTHIGANVFYGCTNLTKIVIPDTVTDIGDNEFGQKLVDVTCPAAVLPYLRMHYVQRVTITSGNAIPNNAFSGCSSLTKVVMPDSITSIGKNAFSGCSSLTEMIIPDGVTSIGDYAFHGCSKLTKIVIPDTVTSIGGDWVLIGCTNLKEVTCPAFVLPYLPHKHTTGTSYLQKVVITSGDSIGAEAFRFCSNLTEIVIADSVTSIGTAAFYSCSALKKVSFGENSQLQSIGIQAFYNCIALTQIVLPDSVTSIGESAFMDCRVLTEIVIPDGVTSISDNTFVLCPKLSKVVLGDGVTSIGVSAFSGCVLTEIVIPDSVTSIGESAFSGCKKLTNVYIGESSQLQTIDKKAFYQCSALKGLVIPDSVTSIGENAFTGCSNLTEVIIPNSEMSINNSSFSGCENLVSVTAPIDVINNLSKSKLQKVVITSGESIDDYAFRGCTALTDVEMCDGITSIGMYAFQNCSKITKLSIPNSVTNIGYAAFYGCSGLTEIIIPNSVTDIGGYAFAYCTGASKIVIPDSVQTIGEEVVYACSALQYNIKDGLRYIGNENNPYVYLVGTESMDIASANIADGCKFIGTRALQHRNKLLEVIIPNSVTSIGEYAFYNCTSLAEITLPSSVTSIGAYAFDGCRALKTFAFDGTMEQWGVVEKGMSWSLNAPIKKVICDDGDVVL